MLVKAYFALKNMSCLFSWAGYVDWRQSLLSSRFTFGTSRPSGRHFLSASRADLSGTPLFTMRYDSM